MTIFLKSEADFLHLVPIQMSHHVPAVQMPNANYHVSTIFKKFAPAALNVPQFQKHSPKQELQKRW